MTYRIRGWAKHYEHHDHKKHPDVMKWVKITTAQDSFGFRNIAKLADGTAIMGAWVMIVEIAAKCTVRGTLAERGNSLTSDDFHTITGHPKKVFDRALKVLSSDKVGWIEAVTPELVRSESGKTPSTIPNHTKPDPIPHDQTRHNPTPHHSGDGLGKGLDGNGVEVGGGSGIGLGSALRETLLAVKPRPPDTGGFDFDDKSDAKKMLLDFGVKEAKASDLIKSSYVTAKRVRDEIRKVNRDQKAENKPGVLIYRLEERRSG